MDRLAKEKLEPFIDNSYKALAQTMNAYAQKMEMGREAIADKGIWTAKKRYILNVHDMEGVKYKEPQLKIMGIEAVKSSPPAPCREKIKSALKIIMSGDEKMLNSFTEFRNKVYNTENWENFFEIINLSKPKESYLLDWLKKSVIHSKKRKYHISSKNNVINDESNNFDIENTSIYDGIL